MLLSLASLEVLCVDNNQLEELPVELCWLQGLNELRVCNNNLQCLPLEIGLLHNISKMYLSQNRIKELPEVRVMKLKYVWFSKSKSSIVLLRPRLSSGDNCITGSSIALAKIDFHAFEVIPKYKVIVLDGYDTITLFTCPIFPQC